MLSFVPHQKKQSEMPSRTDPRAGAAKVTKADWLNAALLVLVTDGVDHVLILPLAAKLKVSRSSFYWYFKNRQDLLDQLLAFWRETNTQAIVQRATREAETVMDGVLHIFECWLDESLFSPRLDFAVRNWARQSSAIRRLVEKADSERLGAVKSMFQTHGYSDEDAFIRARVLYYMQIGYYVLDVKEALEERLSHTEAYLRAFTGQDLNAAQIERLKGFFQTHRKHSHSSPRF